MPIFVLKLGGKEMLESNSESFFSSILAGLIFGSFGLFFIKKARQKGQFILLLSGLSLLLWPYLITLAPNFMENSYFLWGGGFTLLFLMRRHYLQ